MMIYVYNDDYELVAIPSQGVKKIERRTRLKKIRSGEEIEIPVYRIEYTSGGELSTTVEPFTKELLPLPSRLEVWAPVDIGSNEIEWDIAQATNGAYSIGIFSNSTTLLAAITDAHELDGEQCSTLLVDRVGSRARVNTFDSLWSGDLLAVMSELLAKNGEEVVLKNDFAWQNCSKDLPRIKVTANL